MGIGGLTVCPPGAAMAEVVLAQLHDQAQLSPFSSLTKSWPQPGAEINRVPAILAHTKVRLSPAQLLLVLQSPESPPPQ
eukprot:CAMPEP_0181439966 /NCGR_PEP_ID=MMETSP1110-20121109/22717_1 /TAXON_ID=174948 /ORGANISM="Symbiodinium sp., Strain CCMP421" /LENGTH=78 /DNA_ID=CAMNT_0023563741 /DNA_START=246 /DNA_END=483 /DNA_ORIENTATION=-